MGLIMLILIGIVPGAFAVNLGISQSAIREMTEASQTISYRMDRLAPGVRALRPAEFRRPVVLVLRGQSL